MREIPESTRSQRGAGACSELGVRKIMGEWICRSARGSRSVDPWYSRLQQRIPRTGRRRNFPAAPLRSKSPHSISPVAAQTSAQPKFGVVFGGIPEARRARPPRFLIGGHRDVHASQHSDLLADGVLLEQHGRHRSAREWHPRVILSGDFLAPAAGSHP